MAATESKWKIIILWMHQAEYCTAVIPDEPGDTSDDELAVEEEGIATDAAASPDDGRDAHDAAIVGTTCDRAIEMMRLDGIEIDPEEEKMALQLFPRVSFCAL
jgi:hypothetical protein